MIKIFIIIGALIMSGCSTLENGYGPKSIETIEERNALVVISAGSREKCARYSSFLKLMNAGAEYGDSELALIPVDSYAIKSDFSDHQGSVSVLSIPPGRYYFTLWIANPDVKPISLTKADIDLAAGERVYLGEYYMPIACSLSPSIEYRDMKERDLAIVKKGNPIFQAIEFETRLLKDTGYSVGGKK